MEEGLAAAPASREDLVAANLNLVRHLARRFRSAGLDEEDLFQVGCVGLVKAAARYDPAIGNRFSTYAVPVILGEICAFLRGDGPVAVGRSARGLARRARRAERDLRARLGREPALGEVAAAVGAEAADLAAVLEAVAAPVSLQGPGAAGPAAPDGALPLESALAADDPWEERVALRHALAALPDPERRVLELRYFLDRTQQEAARLLGISQPQVSRLEQRALARLRERLG